MQVSCDIELHSWDYACDEFQEDQQCEMRIHLLPVFSHGVRHCLQDIGVLAGMDCWHHPVLDELKFLDCKSLV